MRLQKALGFTLLEVLIALAVFAILATLTSSSLYYAFNTKARVAEQIDRLTNLQLAVIQMERDSKQILLRTVHGNEMQIFPAFVGERQYVEFTRGGFANPSNERQTRLKRIALLCQNNKLLRRTWTTLDTVNRKAFQDKVLLSGVDSCQFAYLNQTLQTLNEWRPNAVQQNQRTEPLPKAIQLNLSLSNWGPFSYLLVIPEAVYADIQT